MSNTFGIDLGTCNVKVFCKATGKVLNEKNTIAIVNKNQMYAYGDQAYAMYEKAPENINVTFPVINGVIADYANMQTMIFEFLEFFLFSLNPRFFLHFLILLHDQIRLSR